MSSPVQHKDLANALRFLAADGVEKARSGHPGMPMGMADVATVLFTRFLKYDALDPAWPDRDRFVLSAGHGSMLIYALLHLIGTPGVTLDELKNFRQLGSKTAGHPEYGHCPGVETTTGPLGQGLANAVGMALAERMMAARFGADIVDHRTYVIAGDGCLMEGLSQEVISIAGHLKLSKLVVLWDDNQICIDGDTNLTTSDDQLARFAASGWATCRVDGHDPESIAKALAASQHADRPTLIACKTVIGFGAPTKAGTEKTHGAPLGADEIAGMRDKLGWPHAPFEIPAPIAEAWAATGRKGAEARSTWAKRHGAMEAARKVEFDRLLSGQLPKAYLEALNGFKAKLAADKPKMATRKASQDVLEVLTGVIPEMVGGSADLTHSNLTVTESTPSVKPGDFSGRYIHYGVREFAMSAVMNGLALHGGFIPYGGTFLVFSDYMRNGMRMSALMGLRVVYVLTHDSIGLGEDGPTHQPVEHVASLRAIPNLTVFRPADAVETAECWQLAIENKAGPSALALSRQNLPTLRSDVAENKSAKGGYVLAEAEGGARQVTIISTGSEVEIALQAREMLQADDIRAAVVSMPSWELFDRQPQAYKDGVLGQAGRRVAVEALSPFGWERYVGTPDAVIGMPGFGASAPADKLYAHFGITAGAVAAKAKQFAGQ
ncbi:MAG: transketolase [Rhodospirillales bacterium]|nr:transketolase [Rhodospirillales bacterium]